MQFPKMYSRFFLYTGTIVFYRRQNSVISILIHKNCQKTLNYYSLPFIIFFRLAEPCSGCQAPYGFKNELSLTGDTSEFSVSITNHQFKYYLHFMPTFKVMQSCLLVTVSHYFVWEIISTVCVYGFFPGRWWWWEGGGWGKGAKICNINNVCLTKNC